MRQAIPVVSMSTMDLAAKASQKPDECPCGHGEAHPHRNAVSKVVDIGDGNRRVVWFAGAHREIWERENRPT